MCVCVRACARASVFVRVFLFSFSYKSVLSRRLVWLIHHSRRATPHYGQHKRRVRCHREAVRVWGASQRVQRQKQGESCTDILKTPPKKKCGVGIVCCDICNLEGRFSWLSINAMTISNFGRIHDDIKIETISGKIF